MGKLYKIFLCILASALVVSLLLNGYLLYLQISKENNPNKNWTKTFNFWWSPEEQNITSGNSPLWINFTFAQIDENLTITVKINDDDNGLLGPGANGGTLILVFDCNFNGKIDYGTEDKPYDFRATNDTVHPDVSFYPNGMVGFPSLIPYPSPWHTCIFSNTTGYTYNISLPIKDIGTTGIIYAIFID
jgi:hypothetical protein